MSIVASGIHIIAHWEQFKPRATERFAGVSGIVLGVSLADERRRHIEMSSSVGWAHTQIDPWVLQTRYIIINIDTPHQIKYARHLLHLGYISTVLVGSYDY